MSKSYSNDLWIFESGKKLKQSVGRITTDSRAPSPTSTTWPGAARIPVRSATAGGTDSAEKNDSWLTQSTVGQWRRTDVPPGR